MAKDVVVKARVANREKGQPPYVTSKTISVPSNVAEWIERDGEPDVYNFLLSTTVKQERKILRGRLEAHVYGAKAPSEKAGRKSNAVEVTL